MNIAGAVNAVTTNSYCTREYARSEGNNVMTWVGFKHIMYLAEETLRANLRCADLGMRRLFEEYGLLLEIVVHNGRILHALKVDEPIDIEVSPSRKNCPGALCFEVLMFATRAGKRTKCYSGRLEVVLRRDRSLGTKPVGTLDPALAPYVSDVAVARDVDSKPAPKVTTLDRLLESARRDGAALHWKHKVPYFYCHGNELLRMSGYIRLMEEADERFCEQQNIGVADLLRRRRWIPAVPSASLRLVGEAYIAETLHVVYRVSQVLRNYTYTSEMECYVERDGLLYPVMAGAIVHAYAKIHDRSRWGMVTLDSAVLDALK